VPMGALWGHLIAMNRTAYDALDEQTRAILDGLGTEYLVKYSALVTRQTDEVLAKWKDMGVEVIPFPREELMKAAASEAVAKVRAEWIEKASRTGLPAQEIADQLTLR
jgi:TRAP-type transport system periplasmic protein